MPEKSELFTTVVTLRVWHHTCHQCLTGIVTYMSCARHICRYTLEPQGHVALPLKGLRIFLSRGRKRIPHISRQLSPMLRLSSDIISQLSFASGKNTENETLLIRPTCYFSILSPNSVRWEKTTDKDATVAMGGYIIGSRLLVLVHTVDWTGFTTVDPGQLSLLPSAGRESEYQVPCTREGTLLKAKSGRPRTCADKPQSDGRHSQCNRTGGSDGKVRTFIGV